MNALKVSTIVMTVLVMLFAMAAGPSGFAQTVAMKADVPFDFYVQGKLMPAGTYTITHGLSQSIICVNDQKGHAVFAWAVGARNNLNSQSKLVFNRYGSVNFLSELFWAGTGQSKALAASSYEKELQASNATPARVALIGK